MWRLGTFVIAVLAGVALSPTVDSQGTRAGVDKARARSWLQDSRVAARELGARNSGSLNVTGRNAQEPAKTHGRDAVGQGTPAYNRQGGVTPRSDSESRQRSASTRRLAGPNVCGGHCCSGWAVAPGSNRCIKPDCNPPCQNRGSCSRPQTCVCRSGFQGSRCEEKAPEQVYIPSGTSRVLQPVRAASAHLDRRKLEASVRGNLTRNRSESIPNSRNKPASTSQVPSTSQSKRVQPNSSPQLTGTSRTVKRFPSGQITSNALPNGQTYNSLNHVAIKQEEEKVSNAVAPKGSNLTAGIDRIKIVFTPMICKQVCNNGHCYNNCEKGDTTTVYSENSQSQNQDSKSGFRLYFCQIPCMNGGRCIGRDHCWCPSNSTGKFCHLPALRPDKQLALRKESNRPTQNTSFAHSMFTLPLSNQLASVHPSLVNVHIHHPPETKVQIHQVARVKPEPPKTDQNSLDGVQLIHSVQQRTQLSKGAQQGTENNSINGNSIIGNGSGSSRQQNRLNSYVGRCFQETVDGQCGKPLPGLTKQDDCCGSIGKSWGLNKCTECPPKPANAVIENGHVKCPKGYKRMNSTHCQDINECLMPGICKNSECLNTRGSYRCTCKPGFMMDISRSHCVSEKAISLVQDRCYRSVSGGTCSLPLTQSLTMQICCCSRVGKGWGKSCERCPLPDTDTFKEICPAGHGYTYSRSEIQLLMRQVEEEELEKSSVHQGNTDESSRRVEKEHEGSTSVKKTTTATETLSKHSGVIEKATPQSPVQLYPDSSVVDKASINVATQITEIDRCSAHPHICGPGTCVTVQNGYTCYCHNGYQMNTLQTHCVDINECEKSPCEGKGKCVNTAGSYTCYCHSGYIQVITQKRRSCQDVNECEQPNICPGHHCINTPGSYSCECAQGYLKSRRGHCEDVDECQNPTTCPTGRCINTLGSFHCVSCGVGYRATNNGCIDEDECLIDKICENGTCVNLEGSYFCSCNLGYVAAQDDKSCHDQDECLTAGICINGQCINVDGSYRCRCDQGFMETADAKNCIDINECLKSETCLNGMCTNMEGSYMCSDCKPGYKISEDHLKCEDINECTLPDICAGGVCTNSEGSFSCFKCRKGFRLSEDKQRCEDINECASHNICPRGLCANIVGSYTCMACPHGHRLSADRQQCVDINECLLSDVCPGGACVNTDGSYSCVSCDAGYRLSADSKSCEDVNECEDGNTCSGGECTNSPGSYSCSCTQGYELIGGIMCIDVNECLTLDICGPTGECMNSQGSYFCLCVAGYATSTDGISCQDVNECEEPTTCSRGRCLNIGGSYQCICDAGFQFSEETKDCEDKDECMEYGINVCGTWRCENTIGSYRCFMGCQNRETTGDCDIDECVNKTICGSHGFCENTDGSYHCVCDQGFQNSPGTSACVDINECESFTAVCGSAFCENVEGTFLCLCPSDNEEFDPQTNQCRNRIMTEEPKIPKIPGAHPAGEEERKECYYNLNDPGFCDSVLSGNTTKQECCCTVGEGWGDNCETHPCPIVGSAEYSELCPKGNGFLAVDGSAFGLTHPLYSDADECFLFGSEICKNGVCINTVPRYRCICRDGFYYDTVHLECVDNNECEHEDVCEDGECVNTPGSYNCFCSPPLILDVTRRRCVNSSFTTDLEGTIHLDICWKELIDGYVCSAPQLQRQTTFTECCCMYGVAWSNNCALCPTPTSEEYAMVCNRAVDGLRERPGYEYGPDIPFYSYNVNEPAYGPPELHTGPFYPARHPDREYSSPRVPSGHPRQYNPPLINAFPDRYDGFEGLQAEECGILNGCENGRCVRVREGYTCDCFDGYELDLTKMACLDINECKDISDRIPLCKNGKCENTEGSYRCECLPGFVASAHPDQCIHSPPKPGAEQ
ncbi:latent-transforming growth factor beta-binding protein 2-like isoform X2 [Polypterus senegalus]|uniref:latent-transforming growth factor beta-binding protein 2-like isoform X2 n=1 Tax=Polypterus senegalus TaxID=55291 RepID=UPI0019636BFA|nr:latent-transforming growth factor beta-binding protein 2-like isoform X2 [Polypterus senegalus]